MALFEVGGRVAFSQGIASSFRPRKYYTLPKETIEAVLEDFEQLVDFVLIEFQRILFAENIVHTIAVRQIIFLRCNHWMLTYCLVRFCRVFCILVDQDPSLLGAFLVGRHHCVPRASCLHQQSRACRCSDRTRPTGDQLSCRAAEDIS